MTPNINRAKFFCPFPIVILSEAKDLPFVAEDEILRLAQDDNDLLFANAAAISYFARRHFTIFKRDI